MGNLHLLASYCLINFAVNHKFLPFFPLTILFFIFPYFKMFEFNYISRRNEWHSKYCLVSKYNEQICDRMSE